jgi:hypothetical protein
MKSDTKQNYYVVSLRVLVAGYLSFVLSYYLYGVLPDAYKSILIIAVLIIPYAVVFNPPDLSKGLSIFSSIWNGEYSYGKLYLYIVASYITFYLLFVVLLTPITSFIQLEVGSLGSIVMIISSISCLVIMRGVVIRLRSKTSGIKTIDVFYKKFIIISFLTILILVVCGQLVGSILYFVWE